MIPIIQDIIKQCQTGDILSEIGFFAGILLTGYGIYKYADNIIYQKQSDGNELVLTTTGGIFMIASYRIGMSGECLYRYQD